MNKKRNKPFISILITTYDRAFFLGRCLESIQEAFKNSLQDDTLELILLNNGSVDDTQAVIEPFMRTLPLTLLYEEKNIGFVPGVLKCISRANGEYCWLLGDDDYITGPADDLITFIRNKDNDITLLNHFFYIYENNTFHHMMKDRKNFLMRSSRDSYSNHADYIFSIKHQNAFFTHIAPIIFKKDLWEHFYSEEMVKKHQASFSIHVYLFLSILKMASKIGFYPEQILALRVGYPLPEWLTEDGRYDRIRMDVINFTDMVRDVFHEESIIRHFKDIMLKKSVFILIAGSKIRCSFPTRFYIRLLTFLFAHYKTHPFFWYAICPALLIPRIAVLLPYRWFVQKSK